MKKLGVGFVFVVVASLMVAAWAQDAAQYFPLAKGNKWVYESVTKVTVDVAGMKIDAQDTKGTTTDEVVGPSDQVTDPKDVLLYRSVRSEKGTLQGQDSTFEITQNKHLGWAGDYLSLFQEKMEGIPGRAASTEKYNAPLRVLKKTVKEGDTWELGTPRQGKLSLPTRVKVAAPEDVTVPAGTFKQCLKVVEEVAEPKGQVEGGGFVLDVKKGFITTTSWFASGVGLVKEESNVVMTLEVMGMQVELTQTHTRALKPGYTVSK